MTIQDLRIAIAALPDDMEVVVDAYEMGLIEPQSCDVKQVARKNQKWIDECAPMLGTHCLAEDYTNEEDGPSFAAFYIERR